MPPSEGGAAKLTTAISFPAVAVTPVGASGTVGVATTVTVVLVLMIVPFFGDVRLSRNVSGEVMLQSRSWTRTVWVVTPGVKVRVPVVSR